MRSIYILLTRTSTIVSKIIGLCTADSYTHASICFSDDLQPFYSFARRWIHLPLPAGLCTERLDRGVFKVSSKCPCALYVLETDDKTYNAAKWEVQKMMKQSDVYGFNVLGLFLCKMNIPYKRKRHYFCSEFVAEVLERSNTLMLPKHRSLMRPNDYSKLPQASCIYKGSVGGLLKKRSALSERRKRLTV